MTYLYLKGPFVQIVGLSLIAVGVFGLLILAWQQCQTLRYLRRLDEWANEVEWASEVDG